MCLIVLHPAREKDSLSREQFGNAWAGNDDGFGQGFVYNGELITEKPFFDEEDAWEAYRAAFESRDPGTAMVIHFRLATSGDVDYKGTHPHPAGINCVLAHNGILGHGCGRWSDTAVWAHSVCWNRTEDELLSKAFRKQQQRFIEGSKIVLLGPSGKYSILNAKAGQWVGRSWHSNGAASRKPFAGGGLIRCYGSGRKGFQVFDKDDAVEEYDDMESWRRAWLNYTDESAPANDPVE